jgi:thiol-disulfide isomerase/thioredoxin
MRSFSILLLGLGMLLFACKPAAKLAGGKSIRLSGALTDCGTDSIRLFRIDGVTLRPLYATWPQEKDGKQEFEFRIPGKIPQGFYFIGSQPQSARPVILGSEKELRVEGSCTDMRTATILNSPINADFNSLMQRYEGILQNHYQLNRQYQQAMQTQSPTVELDAQMRLIDSLKVHLLDSLEKKNPYLYRVGALRTYLSYQVHGEGYPDEPSYFASEFFKFTDFTNPVYDLVPYVSETVRLYANTMASIGLSSAQQQEAIGKWLSKVPEGSGRHKAILIGLAYGFMNKNTDSFIHYARQYLETYPYDNPDIEDQLSEGINQHSKLMAGSVAPEITQLTPAGDTLSLSDLRGKYVLIDFWASWCGPCRKENPNVKRVYEKYKDKGFEILGVSLDNNQQKWVEAIEKDGLPWPHVSDLKHWKNAAAVEYGVSAIPYTVLIDPDGRILGKKLRGGGLEKILAEIFGE